MWSFFILMQRYSPKGVPDEGNVSDRMVVAPDFKVTALENFSFCVHHWLTVIPQTSCCVVLLFTPFCCMSYMEVLWTLVLLQASVLVEGNGGQHLLVTKMTIFS